MDVVHRNFHLFDPEPVVHCDLPQQFPRSVADSSFSIHFRYLGAHTK